MYQYYVSRAIMIFPSLVEILAILAIRYFYCFKRGVPEIHYLDFVTYKVSLVL